MNANPRIGVTKRTEGVSQAELQMLEGRLSLVDFALRTHAALFFESLLELVARDRKNQDFLGFVNRVKGAQALEEHGDWKPENPLGVNRQRPERVQLGP